MNYFYEIVNYECPKHKQGRWGCDFLARTQLDPLIDEIEYSFLKLWIQKICFEFQRNRWYVYENLYATSKSIWPHFGELEAKK